MHSAVRHQYDSSLVFRAPLSANLTSTTDMSTIDLHKITGGARPLGDVVGHYGTGAFDVVLFINSYDHTTGDETYTLNWTTYDAAGANPVVHDSHTVVAADVGKVLVYSFKPETLLVENANAFKFGFTVTVGGTTPIINLWSFAAPSSHV